MYFCLSNLMFKTTECRGQPKKEIFRAHLTFTRLKVQKLDLYEYK